MCIILGFLTLLLKLQPGEAQKTLEHNSHKTWYKYMKTWHKDIDIWLLGHETHLRCSPVLTSTSKNRHELGLEIISLGPFSQPILYCEQKNTYFLPSQLIISSGRTSFSPRFISTTSPDQTSNCSNQLNGCNAQGWCSVGSFFFVLFFFFPPKAGLSL